LWQNILTKLPVFTGQARNATTPFDAWNCLTTNEILYNTVHVEHTNQHIPIIHPNSSHERDVELSSKTEIKAFIRLPYLAGALWSNKLSLEELWSTDRWC